MSAPIERVTAGATRTAPPAASRSAGAAATAAVAAPADADADAADAAPADAAKPSVRGTPDGVDDTADVPEGLSTALARRAELLMLLARERDQTQQAKLDRMRSTFDNAQEERAERLRQMNSLRDMAMEQMKKDDEILKKFIALI